MPPLTLAFLSEQLELGEQLLAGKNTMFEPQDLPGRYGRVVAAIDRVLAAISCPAALGGGWAVWRHGFFGRVTQDVDIVLPADRIEEFSRTAAILGFAVLTPPAGRWPKVRHKETDVTVDILPEGGIPGTIEHPAPTAIPHPRDLGATHARLQYVSLPDLVMLKLGAARLRDEYDIVELIRANAGETAAIRQHLTNIHPAYSAKFAALEKRAAESDER